MNPNDTNIERLMRRNLVRFIVQQRIFCPITDTVLDMDTCVVINDADGDPVGVFSQEGWRAMVDVGEHLNKPILAEGFTVDESTVRS